MPHSKKCHGDTFLSRTAENYFATFESKNTNFYNFTLSGCNAISVIVQRNLRNYATQCIGLCNAKQGIKVSRSKKCHRDTFKGNRNSLPRTGRLLCSDKVVILHVLFQFLDSCCFGLVSDFRVGICRCGNALVSEQFAYDSDAHSCEIRSRYSRV